MGAPNADAFCEPDRDGEDEELAPVSVFLQCKCLSLCICKEIAVLDW